MKAAALKDIERNIASFGQHTYLVLGEAFPRYAYTIGLTEAAGAELVVAGGIYYDNDEAYRIIREISERLRCGDAPADLVKLKGLGSFQLRKARKDWIAALMLGAVDYYKDREVVAYQVLPSDAHFTGDVPDMTKARTAPSNRGWAWFDKEWPFRIPKKSVATTNLAALQGRRVTEAARWEEDEWELFAGPGPDVKEKDARSVPLGVLLGIDESLRPVVSLEVGQALWRDENDGDWNPWVSEAVALAAVGSSGAE